MANPTRAPRTRVLAQLFSTPARTPTTIAELKYHATTLPKDRPRLARFAPPVTTDPMITQALRNAAYLRAKRRPGQKPHSDFGKLPILGGSHRLEHTVHAKLQAALQSLHPGNQGDGIISEVPPS